jgi:hypothetical protein
MRKRRLLEDIVVRGATYSQAFRAIEFMVEWGRIEDRLERPITVEEYALAARVGRAQAFRRQANWRRWYQSENDATPSRMWALAREHVMANAPLKIAAAQAATLAPGYD